ncbi:alpha/beta fold hydrolase [Actinokineospora bangkokensis]|uniref:alpha/beta fold hydrolase n=1 Tax=Actinokineospora bangkokensis TaxID=1193682 RepID=UPI000AD8F686|nr:alpha/beta hydrolase [Actinokineospora bangkokensis]
MDRIELDGGSIRYRVRGSGQPLVLLATLQGSWLRQVRALTEHFTTITYDMRGFGDSPSLVGFPTNAEHADDLAALLDHLGVERAVVVGMSHGGLVAQHFAAKHAERLAGLGLIATFGTAHGPTKQLLRMLNGFLERDDLPGFWEVLKSMLFSEAGVPALLRHEAALRKAMFDQYDVAALSSIYGGALEHDSQEWLGAPGCPALVVGGAEDILFPPVLTERLGARLPGARVELLPAAHIPPVEDPDRFNALLLETFGAAR